MSEQTIKCLPPQNIQQNQSNFIGHEAKTALKTSRLIWMVCLFCFFLLGSCFEVFTVYMEDQKL